MGIHRVVGCALVGLAACQSEASDVVPDAAGASPDAFAPSCWFESPREPRGSATLGKGSSTFEDLGDAVALEYLPSGGWWVLLNVRTHGLPAGDPMDILDPANPFTRIRAFFADTGLPLNRYSECAFRYAYRASPSGDLELAFPIPVIAETCWNGTHLIDRQVRLELEVLAPDGGYASDVRTVTLTAPPEGTYPIEQGTPGCEAR